MAELRRYRDINNVSVFVNPDHIVAAVLNRNSNDPNWKATLTLTDGARVVLVDGDVDRLRARILDGDR